MKPTPEQVERAEQFVADYRVRDVFGATAAPELELAEMLADEAEREREALRASLAEAERERDNWLDSARQSAMNAEFYRGLVTRVGDLFGVAARTSDDGSVQDSVLALKVPELVATLQRERDEARESVVAIKSFKLEDGKIDAALAGDAVLLYAATMADWFKGAGATNFVTATLRDARDGAAYDITMQKIGARPQAEVLGELRAANAALSARLLAALRLLERAREELLCPGDCEPNCPMDGPAVVAEPMTATDGDVNAALRRLQGEVDRLTAAIAAREAEAAALREALRAAHDEIEAAQEKYWKARAALLSALKGEGR